MLLPSMEIDRADTAWMLVSTALVLLMTPALALFYGGLVRSKNVLSTFMHCFFALGLVSLQWVIVGYSLAFGPTVSGIIGNLDYALLRGVGLEAKGTIPHLLFCAYQLMFAIITPALISGAFAERVKFSAYALFTLLWTTLVYDPICHWVWGPGGWLAARGGLDFAGGTVVHLSSGASALIFAIVVGKRLGYPRRKMVPHNLTMTLLGAGLLWFGWFGFNAGSALASNGLATLAFVNTHLAAAAGALSWACAEWGRHGKPSALGVASGLVAGLVAITPAAGFVTLRSAVVIGLVAGLACYWGATGLKRLLRVDDSLDVFGVHGVGGIVGSLLTGVLASKTVGGAAGSLLTQAIGVGAVAAYSLVVTAALLWVVNFAMGLRVDEQSEQTGLDIAQHRERLGG